MAADIEAGYGETPDAEMKSVAEIIRAGAVGANLEDRTPRGATLIRKISDAGDRIRAAREAARAAANRHQRPHRSLSTCGTSATTRHASDETVTGGEAYLTAGAECVYPITLRDPGRSRDW